MGDQGFATPAIEQAGTKNKRLTLFVTLNGNTTAASITGSTNAQNGAALYLAAASLTAPTDANFASLTSTSAPVVFGVYINADGRATRLNNVVVPTPAIRSPSMTAGVITFKGAVSAISGNTGVTTSGNLAFQVSCTTLDLDAQIQTHTFPIDIEFDVL